MLFTSAITNLHSSMNLPPNIEMDIDNFVGRDVNNYNDIRSYSITFNKNASKTVLMFLSEILVNYTTRMEQLNNISDKGKTKNLINNL